MSKVRSDTLFLVCRLAWYMFPCQKIRMNGKWDWLTVERVAVVQKVRDAFVKQCKKVNRVTEFEYTADEYVWGLTNGRKHFPRAAHGKKALAKDLAAGPVDFPELEGVVQ